MRTSVILPLFVLAWAAAVSSSAEVIHLKNGRTIWADHVRENGAHLEYDIGDNTYAIPKASVERIEAGGVAPAATGATSAGKDSRDLPTFAPIRDLKNDSTLVSKIIPDGQVDSDALIALEKAGDAQAAAAGYFIAGQHEFDHGDLPKARAFFETAMRFDHDNPTILNYYAVLLVRTGHAAEALPYAQQAARIAPDSPDALTVLGYVQFATDHTKDAIATWKHSLELRPDALVRQYVQKAEHDANAEADFSERESNHFLLKFEGRQTSESLRAQLLAALEADYDDLARDLGVTPRDTISVFLYTDQAFFDVTQAPSWTGAINDGKLRIPVNGVNDVTPQLARVLKHELAHSFINQISAGRCPTWLNEGIAQSLEPKQVSNGRLLAALFKAQREMPLNALEGSFMRFTPEQATVAYEESLAAVQYLSDKYGMSELQELLQRLGGGSSTEAALRGTIHSDYGQLEAEVGQYLIDKYGN